MDPGFDMSFTRKTPLRRGFLRFVPLATVRFHWITMGQGFSGAEKSLLWAAILLFFVIRGCNRHSVDARIGKAFQQT